MKRLFSQRYARAIDQGRITVEIESDVRKKLWIWLCHLDATVLIRPDLDDNWTTNSTVLLEVQEELKRQYGEDDTADVVETAVEGGTTTGKLQRTMIEGTGYQVLDIVELTYSELWDDRKDKLQQEVNKILEIHKCPWRLFDGECFKLDGDFVGARLVLEGHEALASNNFAGAADEFAKAQRELASGETKGAIFYAGASFESVLKVLTGKNNGSARKLLDEIVAQGYIDDLPEQVRQGFADQVMMAIPFLRNRLGGHGQGATIVGVSEEYGNLAVQMTAALHNFLVCKYLNRPRETATEDGTEMSLSTDEIPF